MVAFALASAMRKVRRLGHGESFTVLLMDAREVKGNAAPSGSMRALITRHMVDGDVQCHDVELQEADGCEVWGDWEHAEEATEPLTRWRFLTVEEVATLLPYLQMVADRERRFIENTRGND